MRAVSTLTLHEHYTALHGYAKIIRLMQVMADILRIFSFGWHYIAYRKGKIMPSLSIKRYVVSLLPIH